VPEEVERPPHLLHRVDRHGAEASGAKAASATRPSRVVPR
jgi:hypothetical protein